MKKNIIGLGVIVALSPTLACADGAYIGGAFGQTKVDVTSEGKAFIADIGAKFDDTDTGFKFFGGYRVNGYLALEGFYTDLGAMSVESLGEKVTTEANSIGASVLGILPVTENFELFGKIGFQAWDQKAKYSLGFSGSDSGTDATFGVGATYIMNRLSVRAEFERYKLDDWNIDMMSVGIAYHF